MTIQYEGSFVKSIFRWKGSVWKAIWRDLLIWLVAYYSIKLILLFAISKEQHDSVRQLIKLFDAYTTRLPLEFLLGFYVTTTVQRWWAQAIALPSPHDGMATVAAYIHGNDEESQHLRHTIARYFVLYYAIGYRKVSSKICELFPSNDVFIQIGLMTEEERDIIEKLPERIRYELPLQWITELVRSKVGVQRPILKALSAQRSGLSFLVKHNMFNVPLVYTQTVTIAVYGYFTFCLLGHQFYEPEPKIDTIVPFLTVLRFIFGVGWLKVAQDLAKPFGNDDDDIDLCWFMSTYCMAVFTIADIAPHKRPLKSWSYDDSQYEKLKSCFDAGITKYDSKGKKLMTKLKQLLQCHTSSSSNIA